MHRVPGGTKLVKFSDGGLYRCACLDQECSVGLAYSNLARHLGSRRHWSHWRLLAFGDAQPTAAAWVAFLATVPRAQRASRA